MAYLICDHWIMKNNKVVEHKHFRQATTAKPKSANDKEIELIQREIEIIKKIKDLPIDDQEKVLAELEEIEILRGNEDVLRDRRMEDIDGEPDEDEDENILMKRRIDDESKLKAELQSMDDSKYSVLSYHTGAIESDRFMEKLKGNYKVSESGDSFLQALGVSND